MMSFLMYFCSMDNCRPTPPGGCFHPFDFPVASADLPPSFPDPFAAGPPHPLCVEAARQVMRCLDARTDWREELGRGKMFGVLPAEDEAGRVGFLAAFSGILDGSNRHEGFVPPVYDLLRPDGHFKQEEARISAINRTPRPVAASLRAERASARLPNCCNTPSFMVFALLRWPSSGMGVRPRASRGVTARIIRLARASVCPS